MNKRKGMPFSLFDRKKRKNAHFSEGKENRQNPIDRLEQCDCRANADLLAFKADFCV